MTTPAIAATTTAPADYRKVAAAYRATVEGQSGPDATKWLDKLVTAIHEGLCDETYTVDTMRNVWRKYHAEYVGAASDVQGSWAAMMVAVEDAVRAFGVTQQRRAIVDNRPQRVIDRSVMVPRTDRDAQPARPQPQGAGTSRERFGTVPAGHYAVTIDGALRFFKVDVPERGKWAGFRFVVAVSGDHHRRLNRAEQTEALSAIERDPYAASTEYGRHIGRCGVCNRRLTDPDSIQAGIGPVCEGKFSADRIV